MQLDLLNNGPQYPSGFSYHPDFLSTEEEKDFLRIFKTLEFQTFEMRGVAARRKIIHYGMKYDFLTRSADAIEPFPEWLIDIKERSELFLEKAVSQILITYYPPEAPIGWHFDAPPFESLLGISLLNPCRFLLRKGDSGQAPKVEINLEPRSAYIVRGEARYQWQHHIPPVKQERYSITLRTLKT